MQHLEILDDYVADVVRRLPAGQRDDVGAELRQLLGESLDARAEERERAPDAALALELLAEFGAPEVVAARYQPVGWTIIPPERTKQFLWLAGLGVAGQWVISLPQALMQGTITRWWTSGGLGALWWPGFLVLVAAVTSWRQAGAHAPVVAVDRAQVRPVQAAWGLAGIGSGIAILLAAVWLTSQLPPAASAALSLDATFLFGRAWLVLPLWAGAIALRILAWRAGRWSRTLRQSDAALHGLGAATLVWWTSAGPILQAPDADAAVRGILFVLAIVLAAHAVWTALRDRPLAGRPPLAGVVGALMVTLAGRADAQQSAATTPAPSAVPSAYVRPAAPGELLDIGGRRLHVDCRGPATGPTVIIEAGMSQFVAHGTYGEAQRRIAAFARVCIYDRAGLGWSDADPSPRTHDAMVDDLHRLIKAKRLPTPLVLVGHSMGGLLVRRYAERHPRDVQAVVLLDATPEGHLYTPAGEAERGALVARITAGLAQAKPGVPVVAMPASTPAQTQLAFTPEVLAAVREEYAAIDRTPAAMRGPGGYGTLGSTPLFVVRRGKVASPPSASDEQWRILQESLLGLSSKSTMIVAEGAGHMFVYEQPAIAVSAVRRALGLPAVP